MFNLINKCMAGVFILLCGLGSGCQSLRKNRDCPSPVSQGLNVRDMVDKPAQEEFESHFDFKQIAIDAEKYRKMSIADAMQNRNPSTPWREKNILCLSGGGSFGAFSAGVLYGWSAKGTRPTFDVVTGISTGALIAPFAFLGPAYDEQMKKFYTTLESKDLYKTKFVRGLFGEAFADNSKLADQVDQVLTPQLMQELAEAHQAGRRLYIGTTAAESKRFVIWDIGAIACKGRPQDKNLIKQVLLGSSGIPGFFPPQHINVDLDGMCLTERHIDGGVSQALFMQPPYVRPEHRSKNPNHDLAGANVYVIVAGKLYADPQKIKPLALALAGQEVSAMIYAQTRGDLQRLFTSCLLTGMNFHMTAIPTEYPAPTSSTAFEIPAMVGMFNEGYRMVCEDRVWRKTAPGIAPGENPNVRGGTCLTYEVRGPISPQQGKSSTYFSQQGIPSVPEVK
jgi:predicted patatin/cPLA2 family phospholipase